MGRDAAARNWDRRDAEDEDEAEPDDEDDDDEPDDDDDEPDDDDDDDSSLLSSDLTSSFFNNMAFMIDEKTSMMICFVSCRLSCSSAAVSISPCTSVTSELAAAPTPGIGVAAAPSEITPDITRIASLPAIHLRVIPRVRLMRPSKIRLMKKLTFLQPWFLPS